MHFTFTAIWQRLNTYYASHTRVMIKKLCLLLKTSSISTYILDIKKMVDSLAVVGAPVSINEHVDALLDDLIEDYNGFITSITTRKT